MIKLILVAVAIIGLYIVETDIQEQNRGTVSYQCITQDCL